MRQSVTLVCLTAAVILCGCSTHRADLAASSGLQTSTGSGDSALNLAAQALVEHEAGQADGLSAVSLAPLTSAAALLAQSTPSPQLLSLTRRLAGLLMEAPIGPNGSFGVSAGGQPPQASVDLTATAGLALLDAYRATGDTGDASAAISAATALRQPGLGWHDNSSAAGVRVGRGATSFDIGKTALAGLLLLRVSQLPQAGFAHSATDAFRTIFESQAAVGRWYAVRGTHQPTTARQWGETLYALERSRLPEALGVTGAGIPAFRLIEFDRSGRPHSPTGNDPVGIALACAAIASYPALNVGDPVFGALLRSLRPDGTVRLAGDNDHAAQAAFAQAMAQRVATVQSP
jgi:hypothetical protein